MRLQARLASFLAAVALVAVLASPVLGADDTAVTFGKPEGSSKYGEQIEFTQPIELGTPADRLEVRLTFGDSASPVVQEMPPSGAGKHDLRYTFDFTEGGHLYPNTKITAQWRVYQGADDETGTDGPPVTIIYDDDRFDWDILEGDYVRVHWYEGNEAFGRRVLELGEKTVRETAELLGVSTGEPFDFFIYPDYFLFHVGRPLGDHARLDIWPRRKEVVVPEDPQGVLDAINDRAITRLVVEDGEPDFTDAREIFQTWRAVAFAARYGPLLAEHRARMKDTVVWNIEQAARLSARDVGDAEVKRTALYHRVRVFMERHEFLVLPSTQVPPFDVTEPYVTEIDGVRLPTYIDWMRACSDITVTGLPAISVPGGFTADGLPVGLQIVGRHQDEWGVLQLAHAFEQATGFVRRRPPLA